MGLVGYVNAAFLAIGQRRALQTSQKASSALQLTTAAAQEAPLIEPPCPDSFWLAEQPE